jgi:hypothetical protein
MSGLRAGFDGILTRALSAMPGVRSVAAGARSLLGGACNAITGDDHSELLSGLHRAATDVLASPTLGPDIPQHLTEVKASDHMGSTWGQEKEASTAEYLCKNYRTVPSDMPEQNLGQVRKWLTRERRETRQTWTVQLMTFSKLLSVKAHQLKKRKLDMMHM